MIKSDMRCPEYGERQNVDTTPPVEVVSGLHHDLEVSGGTT